MFFLWLMFFIGPIVLLVGAVRPRRQATAEDTMRKNLVKTVKSTDGNKQVGVWRMFGGGFRLTTWTAHTDRFKAAGEFDTLAEAVAAARTTLTTL